MPYTDEDGLPQVSEEEFRQLLGRARAYTLVILKAGPKYQPPGPDREPEITAIIKSHGKRNLALRAAGLLPIICPIVDDSAYAGVGVFDAPPAEVERIYAQDPAVMAGVLAYEVHPCRSFPGSSLPEPSAQP